METPVTSTFLIELNHILNILVINKTLSAQVGDIKIGYTGTKEDTISGKRQIFVIERKKD